MKAESRKQKAESRKQNKGRKASLFIYRRNLISVSVLLFGIISCGENVLDEDVKHVPTEKLSIEVPELEGIEYEIPESEKIADLKTLEFKHPLQGVKLIDGKVPGVDIHNSPITGKRFAVGELSYQNEGEKMQVESGVFELDHTPLDRSYKRENPKARVILSKAPKPKIRPSLKALVDKSLPTELMKVRIRVV